VRPRSHERSDGEGGTAGGGRGGSIADTHQFRELRRIGRITDTHRFSIGSRTSIPVKNRRHPPIQHQLFGWFSSES